MSKRDYDSTALYSQAQLDNLIEAHADIQRSNEALRSELAEAVRLLALTQTGSCDGCKRDNAGHGFCPLCGASSRWNDAVTAVLPPEHESECPLGAFLARTAEG